MAELSDVEDDYMVDDTSAEHDNSDDVDLDDVNNDNMIDTLTFIQNEHEQQQQPYQPAIITPHPLPNKDTATRCCIKQLVLILAMI